MAVWTWEREGDARRPIPAVGDRRRIVVDDDLRWAKCVGHGTLRTVPGANDRAVLWELEDSVAVVEEEENHD